MFLFTKPTAAYTSLAYITIGALTDVWSGIWFWYLKENPPVNPALWYFCYGFIFTGLTLLVIGLAMGRIGRSAREAETTVSTASVAPAKTNVPITAVPQVGVPVDPRGRSNGAVVTRAS